MTASVPRRIPVMHDIAEIQGKTASRRKIEQYCQILEIGSAK